MRHTHALSSAVLLVLAAAACAADAPACEPFAWLSGHWCSQHEGQLHRGILAAGERATWRSASDAR